MVCSVTYTTIWMELIKTLNSSILCILKELTFKPEQDIWNKNSEIKMFFFKTSIT
jgi:hypothetical protein